MNKQDWYNMGSQIGDLVQNAIDSNDFKQLNQSIADTVNATVDLVQKKMKEAAQQGTSATWRDSSSAFEQAQARYTAKHGNYKAVRGKIINGVRISGSVKGPVMMGLGYSAAGIFGIVFSVFSILSASFSGFSGPAGAAFLFGLLGLGVGVKGSMEYGKTKRQKLYLNIMNGRDTCSIEELAAASGRSKKKVLKDLRSMMQQGMFPDGAYIDSTETFFLTSKEAYQACEAAGRQYAQRKMQDTAAASNAGADEKKLSAEVQQILKEGREFIDHIHACNAAIPDAEMTEKLSKLEAVVTRIFAQVEAKPESAPDLHKMMSYYLPITRKLVDAYRDMDAQAVEGQNITKTKQEINASLDTINTAFENLLDSFFQNTAWDISSDITVLNTMMAQDGLMKKDFSDEEKKEEGITLQI